MAKQVDTKKVVLVVVLMLLLAAIVAFVIRHSRRKKRAMIIDGILEAAEKSPDIKTNKLGEPCGGSYKAQTEGATYTDAKARELARALVDDIWGYNATYEDKYWVTFDALATPDFIMVVREGNKYIKEKGTSWNEGATDFKMLLKNETCKSTLLYKFCSIRDKAVIRMTQLGL